MQHTVKFIYAQRSNPRKSYLHSGYKSSKTQFTSLLQLLYNNIAQMQLNYIHFSHYIKCMCLTHRTLHTWLCDIPSDIHLKYHLLVQTVVID